jgi:hypothetical protein
MQRPDAVIASVSEAIQKERNNWIASSLGSSQ